MTLEFVGGIAFAAVILFIAYKVYASRKAKTSSGGIGGSGSKTKPKTLPK